jgi:hypothetical protein
MLSCESTLGLDVCYLWYVERWVDIEKAGWLEHEMNDLPWTMIESQQQRYRNAIISQTHLA